MGARHPSVLDPPRPAMARLGKDQALTCHDGRATSNVKTGLILASYYQRFSSLQSSCTMFGQPTGQHTEVSHLKRFEQIELPAKLLNYCSWNNKSNINQLTILKASSNLTSRIKLSFLNDSEYRCSFFLFVFRIPEHIASYASARVARNTHTILV